MKLQVVLTELTDGELYKAEFFNMEDELVGSFNFTANSFLDAQMTIKNLTVAGVDHLQNASC